MSSNAASSPAETTKEMSAAPLPTNSYQFEFACACLNLRVEGRLPDDVKLPSSSSDSKSNATHSLWIGEEAESTKFEAYVNWDQNDFRPASGKGKAKQDPVNQSDDDTLPPCWRKCWACGTRCYKATGKDRWDPAVQNGWVTIDLSTGIIWGKDLETTDDDEDTLPFSSLRLPLSSTSSTFGRPPQTNLPSLYPPATDTSNSDPLIPPVQDPFFLPPPFLPSHPHLRTLCNDAFSALQEAHRESEDEVREYIHLKAKEMRMLEEKVRAEVEMLWEKYLSGPGQADAEDIKLSDPARPTLGERRRSKTVNSVKQVNGGPQVPLSKTVSNNPIMSVRQSSPPYPAGSSLLSASLSANPRPASPPAPIADAVDDSIAALSKRYKKDSDERAVAMSHVFSVLDNAMAGENMKRLSKTRSRELAQKVEEEAVAESDPTQDSWIEQERKMMKRRDDQDDEGGTGGITPKLLPKKGMEQITPGSKNKGKEKAVKFEEPANQAEEAVEIDGTENDEDGDAGTDDPVFDFEMDASPPDPDDDFVSITPPQPRREISRTRNMVEANLSRTFAADAPSHRAAWRRNREQGIPMSTAIRRTSDDLYEGDESLEDQISKLATSMPVTIALKPHNRTASSGLPAMERKTSLTERGDILVPPLIAAMRQRGVEIQNALGLSSSRPTRIDGNPKSHRSPSVSREREREQVKSYKADPGAVFESLADNDDSDEEDDEQGGTLRDSRTFVPPHVLVRQEEDKEGPECLSRSYDDQHILSYSSLARNVPN